MTKGKTIQKSETGEHRADLFGYYERDYKKTGKVPKGFHVWPYELEMHPVRESHDKSKSKK